MTALRELAGALVLLVVLGLRQLVHPAKGITYMGRHRVHSAELSTQEQANALISASNAALVAIDINTRHQDELPRRVPGKTLVGETIRSAAFTDPDDVVVGRVLAGLRVLDVTDDVFAAVT